MITFKVGKTFKKIRTLWNRVSFWLAGNWNGFNQQTFITVQFPYVAYFPEVGNSQCFVKKKSDLCTRSKSISMQCYVFWLHFHCILGTNLDTHMLPQPPPTPPLAKWSRHIFFLAVVTLYKKHQSTLPLPFVCTFWGWFINLA